MIDSTLFAEIGEAHTYMKEQRIKICRERFPNRVVVVDAAPLVRGLDELPSNIREDNEWHRTCDHRQWAQYVTTWVNTTTKMALADTFSFSAREYIASIMTEEIDKKMTENAAKTMADVARTAPGVAQATVLVIGWRS